MAMATLPKVQKKASFNKGMMAALLVLLLLGGSSIVFFASQSGSAPLTNAPAAVNPAPAEAEPLVVAPEVLIGANDQLLVWTGGGAAPGQHSAAAPGELAFLNGDGTTTPVLEIPAQTSRIQVCGDGATSPDGQLTALYVGGEAGSLYVMRGTSAPTKVDDVDALTCLGNGTLAYSPDNARLAYIAFEAGAAQSEFPDGFLHIANTSDLSEVYRYENVVAFDITNEGAAFVSFFTNDKNEADEAAVIWWSGSAEVEVATLQPSGEACRFTSAQIAIAADGKYVLVLGHRCTSGDTRTAWQLYSVDPSSRSATLAASDFQTGSFLPFARTNSIFFAPDGMRAFFTIPDGITSNTVGIKAVNTGDMSLTDMIERQVVMPEVVGAANAFPTVSPDGRWLALVVTSPDGDNTLQLLNLADSSVAPIILSAGSTGDTVSSMAFTSDSARLIAVVGGDDAENNALIGIDLATGNDFRISRGRFGQGLTLSPDGKEVSLLDWQVLEDAQEPPYANTVVIDVETSETATVYTGAEVVDGKVTNQTFLYPLVWRRTG